MSKRPLNASQALTLSLAMITLLLASFQGWSEPWLEFNREAIDRGQWWRLITGHWVHYGFYHLLMNSAALLLCGYVLLTELKPSHYTGLLLTCLVTVGLGLYWGNPQLGYYAGLSGVLHGLLVAGLFLGLYQAPRLYGLALLVVAIKVLREQWPGFDTTHALLPVPVAVDAHLYGALTGLAWGLLAILARRPLHPNGRPWRKP